MRSVFFVPKQADGALPSLLLPTWAAPMTKETSA